MQHRNTADSEEQPDEKPRLKQKANRKRAVQARDRHRCTNCRRPKSVVEALDVDHTVPKGYGGSELLTNNSTLCRQCHKAKEREALAPTIPVTKAGHLEDYTFILYKQFFAEMLPALARQVDIALSPRFGLDDRKAWHMPVGDVTQLDEALRDDREYRSFNLADYM